LSLHVALPISLPSYSTINLMVSRGAPFRIALAVGSQEAASGSDGLLPLAISAFTCSMDGLDFQKSGFIRVLEGAGCCAETVNVASSNADKMIFFNSIFFIVR